MERWHRLSIWVFPHKFSLAFAIYRHVLRARINELRQRMCPVVPGYRQDFPDQVTQDTTLCDSCNSLLRREIPQDHIPSVIRAFALLEAQDRFSDIAFDECEVISLTNAFSMLRL